MFWYNWFSYLESDYYKQVNFSSSLYFPPGKRFQHNYLYEHLQSENDISGSAELGAEGKKIEYKTETVSGSWGYRFSERLTGSLSLRYTKNDLNGEKWDTDGLSASLGYARPISWVRFSTYYRLFLRKDERKRPPPTAGSLPNFWACAYLIQKNEFRVLIDAGSGTDQSHQDLLAGVQEAGYQVSDLTHILVTHAHIDHFGGLSKLRAITKARIGVHELDMQTVAHHEARLALIGRRLASFLTETGLAEEQRDQLLSIYRFTKAIYESVAVDFTYEAAGMRVGSFELIHLPGHCPGHVAIRVDDLVFWGDMVVEGVTPHLSPESINPYSGLDHYLDSLHRLQHWANGTSWVLNGHNEIITDLRAQIEATRENIRRRIHKGLDAFAEPHSIKEVCAAIYGSMEGYNKLLVIEKTGAYIEYLYEHGMIGIANPAEMEQGKPARYRRF